MGTVTDLLERRVYGISQVDGLVGLSPGTARRWIDGYVRGDRKYPPIVREETTGDELVTWGEYVEARLLAEYRGAGVPIIRMRPAVERLRKEFKQRYPLAHANPWLDIAGRELVMTVQQEVGLERPLFLVVVRNQQLMLSEPAKRFVRSVDFQSGIAERVYPMPDQKAVVIDPLRQFGQPVVRSVRTEIIAEQVRAGDPIDMIAEAYELTQSQVEAAIRYELIYGSQLSRAA
jgi:uncharacterized protein (DUF433 family)